MGGSSLIRTVLGVERSLFDNDLKKDVVVLQVTILVLLTSGSGAIGWLIRAKLDGAPIEASTNLLAILLMAIAFVGIAIASWTSLLQITAIVEARDEAEHLFKIALVVHVISFEGFQLTKIIDF
ncbi:hypothetical protein H6G81_32265 [Scytonema hofmannii FACHB-248]|uniref:Uncharacterized protein n=1 Tax=Scytonema hofmannii FACHB-248 TaxID=1842502 RepID=A0ABR8H0V2_9CYAN|nr:MULTISPECIES: hypothetical protein [Nostocales]MBD2609067.1 hypothetical protein [Scytonema hofmannii FACHB-248]